MNLIDILPWQRIQTNVEITSKKNMLETLSNLFAGEDCQKSKLLFDSFIAREKLGSTGLGHGVALPHIRTDLITEPMAALLQLASPLDFDAPDRRPVDIIFALVVSDTNAEIPLQLLAQCSRLLTHSGVRQAIRKSTTALEIANVIRNQGVSHVDAF